MCFKRPHVSNGNDCHSCSHFQPATIVRVVSLCPFKHQHIDSPNAVFENGLGVLEKKVSSNVAEPKPALLVKGQVVDRRVCGAHDELGHMRLLLKQLYGLLSQPLTLIARSYSQVFDFVSNHLHHPHHLSIVHSNLVHSSLVNIRLDDFLAFVSYEKQRQQRQSEAWSDGLEVHACKVSIPIRLSVRCRLA
ncbi:uncharacterized protein YALI1_F23819g [Yarrowia lipolytica]|uniref:Uncharacterized protein n=1 Tax=Yarrowia lipolytica TaxID=4952 RepID=A0A1D8NP09_YARLL|nr:hypothetical protein YALI1_F23819g [Yarrowia lipolytica]